MSSIFPFLLPHISLLWNFLLLSIFISLAMEVGREKKKTFSLKGEPFPEFLGEM